MKTSGKTRDTNTDSGQNVNFIFNVFLASWYNDSANNVTLHPVKTAGELRS